MQEIIKDYLYASKPTPENLEVLAQERIFVPLVRKFYGEFVRNGTNQALVEIFKKISPEYHPPILHTLTTHVTK